jgi:hypothetical protein
LRGGRGAARVQEKRSYLRRFGACIGSKFESSSVDFKFMRANITGHISSKSKRYVMEEARVFEYRTADAMNSDPQL